MGPRTAPDLHRLRGEGSALSSELLLGLLRQPLLHAGEVLVLIVIVGAGKRTPAPLHLIGHRRIGVAGDSIAQSFDAFTGEHGWRGLCRRALFAAVIAA